MQRSYQEIKRQLPPEYDQGINMHGACLEHTFVVLDDDPTGCQTVHDVPVLFSWEVKVLVSYFEKKVRMMFLLVNTRSMTGKKAVQTINEAMKNLKAASRISGRQFVVISRSDSTLRGHYPAEVDAIADHLGEGDPMHCLIPAFFPGGRYTYGDIHYVREGDQLIPAAETPFAGDMVFGYSSSNMADYVEEKTAGRVTADQVMSISLEEMREKGPAFVTEQLLSSDAPVCFVNAMAQTDLDVFAAGAWEAIMGGKKIIFRTGASFLNSIGCIPLREPLGRSNLRGSSETGGIIVVGSYVPKTSAQIIPLMGSTAIESIELPVAEILNETRDVILSSMIARIEQLIKNGRNVMIYTSRELFHTDHAEKDLDIGQQVSAALVELVAGIGISPSFMIAKGGITAHDIASRGLGISRTTVIGQALPGVPVVVPDDRPEMRYIIFPGNVGNEGSLMELFLKLK